VKIQAASMLGMAATIMLGMVATIMIIIKHSLKAIK